MDYCIEVSHGGNSIVEPEYRVVAQGGISEMRHLFPLMVAQALQDLSISAVVLFDSDWQPMAQWRRAGILIESEA